MTQYIIASGVAAVLAGCGPSVNGGGAGAGDADANPSGPDARPGPDEFADAAPREPCSAVDILFVVDDSGSMRHERDNLRANFPGFIAELDAFRNSDGDSLDYRVAVTTTTPDYDYIDRRPILGDVPVSVDGANGELLRNCGAPRPWLERGDAAMADTFACLADVPAALGVLEMPLHAVELAFGARVDDGTNAGFLRDDALLAVVILTDEDDCSRPDTGFVLEGGSDDCTSDPWPELAPIDHYASYLDGVKGGRGRWAVAAFGGICEDDTHPARPAVRLQAFVDAAGQNGVFRSLCTGGDLTGPLSDALATFEAACEAIPPVL